jgi:hypothetical protein
MSQPSTVRLRRRRAELRQEGLPNQVGGRARSLQDPAMEPKAGKEATHRALLLHALPDVAPHVQVAVADSALAEGSLAT